MSIPNCLIDLQSATRQDCLTQPIALLFNVYA